MQIKTNNNRRIIHCSYCNQVGHNIKFCNDESLNSFNIRISFQKEKINIVYGNRQLSIADKRSQFRLWLMDIFENEIAIIKAYSIRYCDGKLNNSNSTHIEKIIDKIFPLDIEENNILLGKDVNKIYNTNILENYIKITNSYFQKVENEMIYYLTKELLNFENLYSYIDIQYLAKHITEDICLLKKIDLEYSISIINIDENDIRTECSICYENKNQCDIVEYECKHKFCCDCVINIIKTNKSDNLLTCAYCRKVIKNVKLYKT